MAILALAAFHLLLPTYAPGGWLALGSNRAPTESLAAVVALWSLFGGVAVFFVWRATLLAGGHRIVALEHVTRGNDKQWMVAGALVAAAASLWVRLVVLGGEAITDDESSYRFASQLLASGRLWIESHPLKIFFDHPFLINDGRMMSVYFLGWPLLRVPFVWLGMPEIANAALFAASVPAVFRIARRLWGSNWARGALILWVSSPFLVVLAATELSHTGCLAAIAWATEIHLRIRSGPAPWPAHAALGAALSLAFWIRPFSTVLLCSVLVAEWAIDSWKGPDRLRRVAAFGAAVLPMALLFVWVQTQLFGSPWKSGYARMEEYHSENEYRFSPFRPDYFSGPVVAIDAGDPLSILARSATGAFRLAADSLGWPAPVVALAVLLGLPASGTLRRMFLMSLLAGGLQKDAGVDTFGPLHFAEHLLPLILLAVGGLRVVGRHLSEDPSRAPGATARSVAAMLLVTLTLTAWSGYVLVRWRTLGAVAELVALPRRAVEAASGGQQVVAFASMPWTPLACRGPLPAHFRFLRPIPGPELKDQVLWVNHLGGEADRRFLELFPERKGLVVRWRPGCAGLEVLDIESVSDAALPPVRTRL